MSLLAAARQLFADLFEAVTDYPRSDLMTPEKHAQANVLDERHRALLLEIKGWQNQTEPPQILSVPVAAAQVAGIPPGAWATFRSICIAHVQAAIDKNREQFEKL